MSSGSEWYKQWNFSFGFRSSQHLKAKYGEGYIVAIQGDSINHDSIVSRLSDHFTNVKVTEQRSNNLQVTQNQRLKCHKFSDSTCWNEQSEASVFNPSRYEKRRAAGWLPNLADNARRRVHLVRQAAGNDWKQGREQRRNSSRHFFVENKRNKLLVIFYNFTIFANSSI